MTHSEDPSHDLDEPGRHRRRRQPVPATPPAGTIEIVRFENRPTFLVRDGSFKVAASDPWAVALEAGRTALEAGFPAVGRIERGAPGSGSVVGTGILVSPDLLVTNRHVAAELDLDVGARIDFRAEFDAPDGTVHPIAEILRLAPPEGPDIALLRLAAPAAHTAPLRFAEAPAQKGQPLVCIGFPGFQHREKPDHAAHQQRLFRGIYDVKRLAPGEVLALDDSTLAHDCTNLAGSSGSALLDLFTGLVVGLDYGYLEGRNVAVPAAVVAAWVRGT
ncbi:MAG: serine protease [Thermoanaerobaculia bacterium]|nr:serine protease [Thermoanaerobaculia bacterium]